MSKLQEIWERITGKGEPNPLDKYLYKLLANNAIYPDQSEETYLNAYTGNNDVFTVINKITEPASTVPVFQYDANGEIVEKGKMIARLNKPNGYQSQSQFIEAALTFYLIFGNSYTAEESMESGLNIGLPGRLDVLPSQWMSIKLGSVFNPVTGYSFHPLGGTEVQYPKEKVYHWKEFNPDYTLKGGHLKGMSRLKPLIKSFAGGQSAYNSLVTMFQSQGMWGILTLLDEPGKSKNLTKEQKSALKDIFRRDAKKGDLTIVNAIAQYIKMGLSTDEMKILPAIGVFKGNLYDAYNVPDILFSGAISKTYLNYREAEQALWRNAIQPSLDAYLEGLSNWLAPKFKEEGNVLKADYSEIACLQANKEEMVRWMTLAQAFSRNEIREAVGFERLDLPGMDDILISMGLSNIGGINEPPEPEITEELMKRLNLTDYRK